MNIFILGSYVYAHCLTVKHLPSTGESLTATGLRIEHGGKGLNLAVAMHRMGVTVEPLFAIGEDIAADGLLTFFQEQGLSTRHIVRTGPQSGYGVGFIDPGGNNFLAIYPGANGLLTSAHVHDALAYLTAADLVCAQFEIPDSPILAAFRHARHSGIKTFLNPSPWRELDPALLELTDILVVNESEAACLLAVSTRQTEPPEYWLNLLQDYCWQGQLLVITLAEQGCVAWYQGRILYQPAWSIDAVDATGAGDAFSAGLAVALGEGKPVEEALNVANACGAWVAARLGVLQAVPTALEIKQWMQEACKKFV